MVWYTMPLGHSKQAWKQPVTLEKGKKERERVDRKWKEREEEREKEGETERINGSLYLGITK